MYIKIGNIRINYIQYGEGEDIILLHGWGQNIEMMKPLGDNFSKKYRINILDLPGFGNSEEPREAWSINDYRVMLEKFVKELNIKNPIVIGHSFGGRVAICYSAVNKIKKLVLFGSPCIRREEKLSLKVKVLKGLKKLPLMDKVGEVMKNYIGSRDYKNATPIMRETLVNVVNEDLSSCAKKIKVPTLLIWGDNDTEAPVEDARGLESIMEDAGLIILSGSHYAYLENLGQVVNILDNFF